MPSPSSAEDAARIWGYLRATPWPPLPEVTVLSRPEQGDGAEYEIATFGFQRSRPPSPPAWRVVWVEGDRVMEQGR